MSLLFTTTDGAILSLPDWELLLYRLGNKPRENFVVDSKFQTDAPNLTVINVSLQNQEDIIDISTLQPVSSIKGHYT